MLRPLVRVRDGVGVGVGVVVRVARTLALALAQAQALNLTPTLTLTPTRCSATCAKAKPADAVASMSGHGGEPAKATSPCPPELCTKAGVSLTDRVTDLWCAATCNRADPVTGRGGYDDPPTEAQSAVVAKARHATPNPGPDHCDPNPSLDPIPSPNPNPDTNPNPKPYTQPGDEHLLARAVRLRQH